MAEDIAPLLHFSQSARGAIVAHGPALISLLRTAFPSYQPRPDRHPFISLASPSECRGIGTRACLRLLRTLSTTVSQPPLLLAASPPRLHSVAQLHYIVIFWPTAQLARSKISLPRTVFHIKLDAGPASDYEAVPHLGFLHHAASVHLLQQYARGAVDMARQHPSVVEDILYVTHLLSKQDSTRLVRRQLAEIRFVLLARQNSKNQDIICEANALVQVDPTYPASYLHRAHALCCAGQHWHAVLDIWYAVLALNQHPKLDPRSVTLLVRCIPHVPFVGLHVLYNLMPVDAAPYLQSPYHPLMWPNLSQSQQERYFQILNLVRMEHSAITRLSNTGLAMPDLTNYTAHTWLHQNAPDKYAAIRLPHLFSWVIPFRLAGSTPPSSRSQLTALKSIGFTLVVNTTMKRHLQPVAVTACLRTLYLPVPQFGQPSFAQIDAFVVRVAAERMTLVYCTDGESLTGTFMVLWLMVCGSLTNTALCTKCVKAVKENGGSKLFVGCCRDTNCALVTREPAMSAAEAIHFVRRRRPCSVNDTFVKSYYAELWRRHNLLNEMWAERDVHKIVFPKNTSCVQDRADIDVLGRSVTKIPSLIVLCGLPGSGKSYFASKLNQLDGNMFVVANQDTLGSRKACASVVANAAKNHEFRCAVVDRCNLSLQDRTAWFENAFRPKNAIIVHMKLPTHACIARAETRIDHPTLVPGSAAGVISSLANKFQPPGRDDLLAGFQAIYVVQGSRSFEMLLSHMSSFPRKKAAISQVSPGLPFSSVVGTYAFPQSLITEPSVFGEDISITRTQTEMSCINLEEYKERPQRLSNFFKFPRTKHLLDLGGSVSDDDIIMTDKQAAEMVSFFDLAKQREDVVLTIEEKVDGANLGFSICPRNGGILVQNRSHYVNNKSHPQFKLIGHYVQTYEEDLRMLLRGGQRVLYGEWMYFQHSILYSNLPSVFLAFDLFDIAEQKFLSRSAFRKELMGTHISMVEQLPVPEDITHERLQEMVANCRSNYYEGRAEGLYIRLDSHGWLQDRAKVVRPNFISGNEHWTKRKYQRNKFGSL